jgi:hypothetical protein
VTNEELQAMLAAAYGGQINHSQFAIDAEPRSEWDSYKYNQANQGRTAGDVEPKSMGWGEYAQEWYDRLIGTPLKGMAGAGDALLGRANPDLESFEKNVLDALSLYAGPTIAKGMLGGVPKATELSIFGGVGAKEAPGNYTKLYRSGRPEGRWWSADKEYTYGMGGGRDHTDLPVDMSKIKVLESTKDEIFKLMTPEEKMIVGDNPTWKSGSNPRLAEKVYDDVLERNGYDAFHMLDATGQATANEISDTFYFRKSPINEPKPMRAIAEAALAAGKDPDEVWKYTGWKPGMEGKMRFEIDDRAMKFKGDIKSSNRLSDIVEHDQLFNQYPEIDNVPVFITIDPKIDKSSGYFHGSRKGYAGELVVKAPSEDVAKDTLIHEIQHWVQQKEGFARGSQPEYETIRAMNESPASEALFGAKAEEVGYQRYRNVAGEIESRDAAARRTWDTDMRRAVPPDMRKDAIIRMGNSDLDAFAADVLKELNY